MSDFAVASAELASVFYGGPVLSTRAYVDRRRWPAASSDYLFVWGAIDYVGSKIAEGWLPTDLWTCSLDTAPSAYRASLTDRGRQTYPDDDRFWSREQEKWENSRAAIRRLGDAIEWLATKLRDGDLSAYLMPARGGPLDPADQAAWFGLRKAENQIFAGHIRDQHIFVRRSDIETIFNVRAPAPTGVGHLSPYLKLMLAVAAAEQVTPENQPKIESLKLAIQTLAPQFGLQVNPHRSGDPGYKAWMPEKGMAELTGKLFDAIPTLIREISSQTRKGG